MVYHANKERITNDTYARHKISQCKSLSIEFVPIFCFTFKIIQLFIIENVESKAEGLFSLVAVEITDRG